MLFLISHSLPLIQLACKKQNKLTAWAYDTGILMRTVHGDLSLYKDLYNTGAHVYWQTNPLPLPLPLLPDPPFTLWPS